MERPEPGTAPVAARSPEVLFPGGGQLGALVRGLDWAATPVGPMTEWPESLRTALRIVLNSRYPMFIWWGPALTNFYNDAYVPFLGAKHPAALGRPGRDVWAEIWDVLQPFEQAVFARAEASYREELLLVMERHGFKEETYFTFSYSPILEPDGRVAGLFCACTEDTSRVLAARRMHALRTLADRIGAARSPEAAVTLAAAVLTDYARDVPFSTFFLLDDDGGTAREVAGAGTIDGPRVVALDDPDAPDPWGLRAVRADPVPRVHDELRGRVGAVPDGPWDEPSSAALVLPLAGAGVTGLVGFAVLGLSPRLALDADYRGFCELVAAQVASGIVNARAYADERRRAEALVELDRAKTAFFSNVSHEFRTPLTLLLGPLEDLQRAGLAPADRDAAAIAHRNALRLLRLVNDLLAFARIEAGRIDATYEPVDLAAYTTDLASVFRAATERAGLALRIRCEPVRGPVFVDRGMWERIVLNLLSNAFKFTLAGSITVTLQSQGDHVVLRVEDSGVGIAPDELPHVFERFRRGRGTPGRTHEGTGIGLALVQELVRLHGGTVTVASEAGRGSTFTVTMPTGAAHLPPDRVQTGPLLPVSAEAARPWVEEALSWLPDARGAEQTIGGSALRGAVRTAGARVLIADDNADMRAYLRRLLGEHWHVATVSDGTAALAAARSWRPDLVLADVMMPGLDGHALVRALREDDATRALPIVLLSARAGEEARVEGLASGADDYLVKPFSARELVAAVDARLELARTRAAAAEALQLAETRHRTLVELVSSAVWIANTDGIVEDRNVAWEQFTGQSHDEYRGFGWLAAVHPDDRRRVLRQWKAAIASGEPYFSTYRVLQTDGDYHHVEGRAVPLRDDAGNVREWIGMITDVDERLRTAEALVRSEARLLLAQRIGRIGVFDCDVPSRRVHWSGELGTHFGLTGSMTEWTVADAWQRVHADDLAECRRRIEACVARREREIAFEFRALLPDGGERWVRALAHVEYDDAGAPQRMIGVSFDVDDLKRATEALEEANARKDEFLAMLGHELRNPLAPIQNAARLLGVLAPSEPRLVRAREIIERQVVHLTRLVDDLLDVSRITRGKIVLQKEPVGLGSLVGAAVETVRPAIERLGHRLEVTIPDPTIQLVGDFARLVQIVSNLLTNAAKFTPARGRIDLRAERVGDEVVIAVTDTGVGIAPELQKKIFDLFVQDETGLARTQGGLGIGLTVVRRLAELHGGRVDVRSEGAGRGSEFVVRLPADPPVVPLVPAHARTAKDTGAAGLAVLLVEDNPDAAESFTLLFELGGHDVRVARDGLAALAVVEHFTPDIAFLDIGLPGIDGYELASRLRAHPACRGATLVAMTGYGRDEDRRRSTDVGFDHHLTKPVSLDTVERLLASVGAKRDEAQESARRG